MVQHDLALQPWQWPEKHWRGLVDRVRAGRRLHPPNWKDGARCAIALSFLGLGIKPPNPSWGSMIAEAKDFVFFEPWLINIPGFALFIFVVGINLLGDGLQDLLSAKSRRS